MDMVLPTTKRINYRLKGKHASNGAGLIEMIIILFYHTKLMLAVFSQGECVSVIPSARCVCLCVWGGGGGEEGGGFIT